MSGVERESGEHHAMKRRCMTNIHVIHKHSKVFQEARA